VATLEPPELARLVDYAECSRVGDWSLRSALVRYAQAEPVRVGQVLDVVRRIEFALHPHAKLLASRGPELWAAHRDGDPLRGDAAASLVVALLGAMARLDQLAEVLAHWAVDRSAFRPDDEVDAAVAEVGALLDERGVGREERERPPGRRSRG